MFDMTFSRILFCVKSDDFDRARWMCPSPQGLCREPPSSGICSPGWTDAAGHDVGTSPLQEP